MTLEQLRAQRIGHALGVEWIAVPAQTWDALIEIAEAAQEARPYVFNRTQESGWRGETARGVLARVDAALAKLEALDD